MRMTLEKAQVVVTFDGDAIELTFRGSAKSLHARNEHVAVVPVEEADSFNVGRTYSVDVVVNP